MHSPVVNAGTMLQAISIPYTIEDNNIESISLSPSDGNDPEYLVLVVSVTVDTSVITELRINDIELVYSVAGGSSIPGWDSLANGNLALGDESMSKSTYGEMSTAIGENALTNFALVAPVTTMMTATFVQPVISVLVSISVLSTAGFAVNNILWISGGGYYSIASIPDANTFSVTQLGDPLNANPGDVIAIAQVSQAWFGNTALGTKTLTSNTSGIRNTAVGYSVLYANTTGVNNTGLGMNSLRSNTTGNSNTGIGYESLFLNTTGSSNTGVGLHSLYSNTTGTSNTGVGRNSLRSNTTGGSNTGIGTNSLISNTTGGRNTGVGVDSLVSNTTGGSNTGVGTNSLQLNTIGENNTGIGRSSLNSNTTGNSNTGVGYGSLFSNITGGNNTGLGVNSLSSNTTGGSNVGIGRNSLNANTTGNNNIGVGYQAGDTITTGSQNTLLGVNSDVSVGTENYSTALGYGAVITGSNQLVLGSATAAQGINRILLPQVASNVLAAFGNVTVNGCITVLNFTVNTGALASQTATITNSSVLTGSQIWAVITNYTGTLITNGIPVITFQNITNGSFVLALTNAHPTNALGGDIKINVLVMN